jgi:nicotinate-nucleotide pyrophosphorylase
MTKEEKTMYNAALKRKWDNHSVMVEAIRDAVEKERAKAEEKLAKAEKEKEQLLLEAKAEKEHILLDVKEKERLLLEAKAEKKKSVEILKRMGMPVKDIAKVVGLSEKEIEQL